jgi:DNA-binding transcriptional MerR regulator
MSETDPFELTTTDVSREAKRIPETVRQYADLGLIECRRLENGTRLFQRSAIDQVRAISEQRLANRGRRPAPSSKAA